PRHLHPCPAGLAIGSLLLYRAGPADASGRVLNDDPAGFAGVAWPQGPSDQFDWDMNVGSSYLISSFNARQSDLVIARTVDKAGTGERLRASSEVRRSG